jgi:hypothetical protein
MWACRGRARLPLHRANRLVNIEGRSGRAQGIVVVGSRGAKKRHHGVADVLVDRAAIAIDDAVDQRRETVDQLMNLLGVQRAGKRRESGEIREQDRDLTSLAVRLERRFRRRARSTRASLVYRREQALAMAERAQSEFFKVSIGEMRQDGKINVIFCEGAPVLPQSRAYPASRLSPAAPLGRPFPLSVPKLRAFVARDALRTANRRISTLGRKPRAIKSSQSARGLRLGQEFVIAFRPSPLSEVRGRRSDLLDQCTAAGPCRGASAPESTRPRG